MKQDTLNLAKIQERRKVISDLVHKLEEEDIELEIAERVLKRMSGNSASLERRRKGMGEGGKSVGDYIIEVLGTYQLVEIGRGMTAPEILKQVRNGWLPKLARTSFSPPLARLCKRGKVIKDEEFYRLPK